MFTDKYYVEKATPGRHAAGFTRRLRATVLQVMLLEKLQRHFAQGRADLRAERARRTGRGGQGASALHSGLRGLPCVFCVFCVFHTQTSSYTWSWDASGANYTREYTRVV